MLKIITDVVERHTLLRKANDQVAACTKARDLMIDVSWYIALSICPAYLNLYNQLADGLRWHGDAAHQIVFQKACENVSSGDGANKSGEGSTRA